MSSDNDLKLLKKDVKIVLNDTSGRSFYACRPGSDKIVELSGPQAFLAENMRQPYSEIVLINKCNARFTEKIEVNDLKKLISVLDSADFIHGDTKEGYPAETRRENNSADEHASHKNQWPLFNPQNLLDTLLRTISFLRFFRHLVPMALILSTVGFAANLDLFFMDIATIKSHVSFMGRILFKLLTISLLTQIYRGLTARHFGFETSSFGLILIFGLIPRFTLRIDIPDDANRHARLWTLGAPVYARFILFPVCVFLWLTTRDQGSSLALISAGMAMITMISMIFVANPLIGGAGYRFISEYFNIPNLRKKSFARLKSFISRQPGVVTQYVDRSPGILVYGVLSVLFTVLLIGFIGYIIARRLELNYQGLGISIILITILYLFFRFGYRIVATWKHRRRARRVLMGARGAQKDFVRPTQLKEEGNQRIFRSRNLSIILILVACFLPYKYESGGDAEVFPLASAQIYTNHPDLIEHIYFNGGEIIEQGTIIAELVNDQQKYDIERTREEIGKKTAELNVLLTTPMVQEVTLAHEQLKKAEVSQKFSQDQFQRMKKLYQKDVVSFVDYQNALKQMELDRQSVDLARADLDYLQNKINPHTIEAARFEISILESRLAYYKQALEHTRLRMPINGKIITMNLKNRINSFLDTDILFAEVEDTSKVRIEMKIPEGDMDQIAVGKTVRLILRAYPKRVFFSEVQTIHPATIETNFGRFVITECTISNENDEFKTGMTGFSKIAGDEMFVVTAFSRAIIRFFKVEVWSWLP